MEVVVTGRHCELTDRFRSHVEEKLSKLEKHDHRIIRVNCEVECEKNPRQADRAVRLQLTALSKGPVIRAEACTDDLYAALDRIVHPPRGRAGGKAGGPGYVGLGSGKTLNGKGRQTVPAGDWLVVLTPGGAGYGAPVDRAREAIASR